MTNVPFMFCLIIFTKKINPFYHFKKSINDVKLVNCYGSRLKSVKSSSMSNAKIRRGGVSHQPLPHEFCSPSLVFFLN